MCGRGYYIACAWLTVGETGERNIRKRGDKMVAKSIMFDRLDDELILCKSALRRVVGKRGIRNSGIWN